MAFDANIKNTIKNLVRDTQLYYTKTNNLMWTEKKVYKRMEACLQREKIQVMLNNT